MLEGELELDPLGGRRRKEGDQFATEDVAAASGG